MYADFGSRTFVRADVAATARPGELPTRLAATALESADAPLLSPAAEGTDTAARAGLLAAIPTGWLAIVGAQPPHDLYAQTADTVLTATQTLTGWDTTITGDPSHHAPALTFDPSVVPTTVPSGVSVESCCSAWPPPRMCPPSASWPPTWVSG